MKGLLIKDHRLFSFGLGLLVLSALSCLIYSNQLRVRTIAIPAAAFSERLKGKVLVHMSDLHVSRSGIAHENTLRAKLAELKPDLIFLTGDYVSWFGEQADYQKARAFLRTLNAPLGVYAVMGDADYSNERESCGFCHSEDRRRPSPLQHVRFLRNAFVEVPIHGDTLRVAGFDDWSAVQPEPQLLPALLGTRPAILLSHSSLPYAALATKQNVLVLSGDTHGGEIYMPAFFWKHWQRKPDPEHMYGYFRNGNKHLYVTSGIASEVPLRLGVPPEIAVFRFQ